MPETIERTTPPTPPTVTRFPDNQLGLEACRFFFNFSNVKFQDSGLKRLQANEDLGEFMDEDEFMDVPMDELMEPPTDGLLKPLVLFQEEGPCQPQRNISVWKKYEHCNESNFII